MLVIEYSKKGPHPHTTRLSSVLETPWPPKGPTEGKLVKMTFRRRTAFLRHAQYYCLSLYQAPPMGMLACGDIEQVYKITYLKVKKFTLMVSQKTTSEASFAQKVRKLSFCARRDVRSKDFPAFLPVFQSGFEYLCTLVFSIEDQAEPKRCEGRQKGNQERTSASNLNSSTCFKARS